MAGADDPAVLVLDLGALDVDFDLLDLAQARPRPIDTAAMTTIPGRYGTTVLGPALG
jgi:hypothetical protein